MNADKMKPKNIKDVCASNIRYIGNAGYYNVLFTPI